MRSKLTFPSSHFWRAKVLCSSNLLQMHVSWGTRLVLTPAHDLSSIHDEWPRKIQLLEYQTDVWRCRSVLAPAQQVHWRLGLWFDTCGNHNGLVYPYTMHQYNGQSLIDKYLQLMVCKIRMKLRIFPTNRARGGWLLLTCAWARIQCDLLTRVRLRATD